MVSVKSLFAYLSFALFAAVVFLYLLFPAEAVKAYMDARLAAIDPSLTMAAETMRPAIPPGLKMTGVDINGENARLVRIDDARVSPVLTTLLGNTRQAKFIARLADGTLQGRVTLEGRGTSGRLHMEADLDQVRIDRIDAVRTNGRFTLSGALKGHVTHDGSPDSTGKTSGLLTISGLRIALKSAFFGIDELVMEQTDVEFSATGQSLRLKSVAFSGPMLEGKITGTIELRRPFGQSRLNLTGNAKPRPELFARLQETIPQGIVNTRTLGTRGLTFTVRGSIDSPNVSTR
jgi:type II secretion system protein N